MRRRVVHGLALVTVAALAGACSESADRDADGGAGGDGETATNIIERECPKPSALACAPAGTTLAEAGLLPDAPTEAAGEPIKLGMMNQDTGPAGAFPELSQAAQAAVEWINVELGGVDGRPIELVLCDTEFSPAGSQQCGQRMVQEGVVAVAGGIDVFGDGIQVLEDNGIAYVGGIPVSFQSARSPVSFQFSGGSWGAFLGFADYAIKELKADEVSIMFGDFGSIRDAAEYGQRALEEAGVDVKMVSFPIITDDFLTPLTAASEGDPDAIFVGAADTACVPVMQGALELQIEAQLFLVGACLSPKILESAGDEATEGRIFNTEQEGTTGGQEGAAGGEVDADFELYVRVIQKYGDGLDPATAGVISFKSFMNLFVQMSEIGADGLDSGAVIEGFRSARKAPSFGGHPYTCDGEQIPELPALCAPQQTLAQRRDGELVTITDWIDVSEYVD